MEKGNLYDTLFQAWRQAKSGTNGKLVQQEVNQFWKENKCDSTVITAKIQHLRSEFKNRVGSVASYFSAVSKSQPSDERQTAANTGQPVPRSSTLTPRLSCDPEILPAENATPKDRPKPSQSSTKELLNECCSTIVALQSLKDKNLLPSEQFKVLSNEKIKQKQLEKKLKTLRHKADRERKYRSKKTKILEEFKKQHPGLKAATDKLRPKAPGRPRIELQQPLLLQTIVEIVTSSCSADDRRRSECMRTCMTLDSLQAQLFLKGIEISRSALHLRLLPKNHTSINGKKHVNTVPVRILKAQNNKRKDHQDAHFAAASVKFIRDLVEMFGPESCFVLSQDDKARVPLGLPAANLQAPILMHMEYKVSLPDHDWVIAGRHKLIPSVYAALDFKKDLLSYSGPTYIAIRSGKHDSSTAKTHSRDFQRLLTLKNFQDVAIIPGSENMLKPIVVFFTDGGPDENPRFPQPMYQAVSHFKKYNLDCIFVATQAPGHSAFNPVERRMAPLSHDLAGIILPHDHFGTHLDSQGRTRDLDLEKKNFAKAGEVLSNIWSETIIDGYEVVSEFVHPDPGLNAEEPSEEWKAKHIRQSHYVLQIVKCADTNCCKPFRTNYLKVLPTRFVPAPVMTHKDAEGIHACKPLCNINHNHSYGSLQQRITLSNVRPQDLKYKLLPFDVYCPSQEANLHKLVCDGCGVWFPSQVFLKSHKKVLKHSKVSQVVPDPEEEDKQEIEQQDHDGLLLQENDEFPVISSLETWLQSPFVEVEDE